ncbi:MAG: DUF3482 domain-containing protein [Phycisphaerales bacterium]|nr:DUF3482 domain-containing protein [Phycisphaerales bacterium]
MFDAREPPRNKYWEEHELLRRCGRPIVAVLNCTGDDRARSDEWDAALRRNGLHAVARFDAWAASEADASRLFGKLRELLGQRWGVALQSIVDRRASSQRRRVAAMAEELATLLVDLASHRVVTPRPTRSEGEAELARDLGEGWRRLRDRLAELHGVSPDRLAAIEAELDSRSAREAALLDPADATLTVGSAIATVAGGILAGGVKGGLIDVGTGGATLGVGMVLGGAAGLALGGRELFRHALLHQQGDIELGLTEAALEAVVRRGVWLIVRLQTYGQASERPLAAPGASGPGAIPPDGASSLLRKARRHRAWSRLRSAGAGAPPRPEGSLRLIERLRTVLAARALGAQPPG